MIIPTQITKYDRFPSELLQFAIFAACVAGKNADQTAKKVNDLWDDQNFRSTLTNQWNHPPKNENDYQVCINAMRYNLEKHKIGQYDRLSRVLFVLNQLCCSLNTVLFNELVNYKGIGPKTAAFFILHSRKQANIPVIDTHICKYMATKGIEMKVTSSLSKYLANAELVSKHISQDYPNSTLAEADLDLWIKFSGRANV